jgi:hypothetical protein
MEYPKYYTAVRRLDEEKLDTFLTKSTVQVISSKKFEVRVRWMVERTRRF